MLGLDKAAARIVSIGVVVCLLIVIGLTLAWCGQREKARDAKAGETIAEGRTVSAVEAINEIGKLGERADATDADVREAQDAVRKAKPEDRNAEFRYRACLLQRRTDCDGLQPAR